MEKVNIRLVSVSSARDRVFDVGSTTTVELAYYPEGEHSVKTPGHFRAIQPAAEAEGPWEVPRNRRKNVTNKSQVSSGKWETDYLDRKMAASKTIYFAKLKELEESLESNRRRWVIMMGNAPCGVASRQWLSIRGGCGDMNCSCAGGVGCGTGGGGGGGGGGGDVGEPSDINRRGDAPGVRGKRKKTPHPQSAPRSCDESESTKEKLMRFNRERVRRHRQKKAILAGSQLEFELVSVGFSDDDDSSETSEENEVSSAHSATDPPENKMADDTAPESSSAGVDSDESDDDEDDDEFRMMHSTSWISETTSTAPFDGSVLSAWQGEALLLYLAHFQDVRTRSFVFIFCEVRAQDNHRMMEQTKEQELPFLHGDMPP